MTKTTKRTKKKVVFSPEPPIRGQLCPNCGQVLKDPKVDWSNLSRYDEAWNFSKSSEHDRTPHENPFDCVRFLQTQIAELMSVSATQQKQIDNLAERLGYTGDE